jgi:hypothetical protein
MKNIDEKIAAALLQAAPEAAVIDEPNLAEELITAFRGRNRWTNALAFIFSVVGLGLMVWSAIRFFHAPEVREQLLWGGFCFFNVLFISFLKVWFWMEMHSNRVLRELKRVELLLEYNLRTRA